MRCLSIRQPWAWAICLGEKTIENRAWSTDYRGTLAIHASSNRQDLPASHARAPGNRWADKCFVLGAVIGLADVVDCLPLDAEVATNPWAEGPFCWKLAKARLLSEPIPLRGRANLFALPCEVLERIRGQLGASAPVQDPAFAQQMMAAIRPGRLAAALTQATSYQRLGKWAEMAGAASQALELDPTCGRAFWLRAVALASIGEWKRVLDDADRAIACGWREVDEQNFPHGNLAAVYHAAECLREQADESARQQTHRYLRQFATIAHSNLRDIELTRRGYRTYRHFDPAAAIRAYASAGSVFDNLEDLTQLAADAATAGLDAAELDHLRLAALAAQSHHTKRTIHHVNAQLDDWFA